jgi:hypothetical protein
LLLAAPATERVTTWHRLQLLGDGFGHLTFDQKDVGQFAITARSLKLVNPLRPIPFWQSNFRPQALQLPAGRLFLCDTLVGRTHGTLRTLAVSG